MKNRIVSLILFLCTVFSLLALASCGPKKPAANPATSDTATAATTDKWEVFSPMVKAIPESDRKLKIEYDTNVTASKASKNDVYLKGPDSLDSSIPKIERMVYDRNVAANELLGTTIEYVGWENGWGKQAARINTLVQAHDASAPDLFVNMLYDLNLELMNGSFKDVWSIPHSFFDFSAPGWLETWMKNLSFTGDRAYILAGDYFLDVLRALTILPFNMTMMDENASKLTDAILGTGETLKAGEKLTSYFFDLVEDGNWTWDVLGELCEAIWVDKGTAGQDDIYDVLGIIADQNQGFSAGGYVYSCGVQLIIQDEITDPTTNAKKQWLRYAPDSTALNLIFDKVKAVFEGNGSLSTNYGPSKNTAAEPGLAYHHTKFAKGEILFGGVCLLGGLEDDVFQQMTDLYSVVPCPKPSNAGTYNTIIYNTGDAGAINVHTSRNKTRVLSAYLQYCTEHSNEIRDEFLENVTKYKTTTYNQGTDRMLDIIYDSILYGRDKTVEDLVGDRVGGGSRWHSMMKINAFEFGSDSIAERYRALRDEKQAILDEVMETWYGLPKYEPPAN